MKVLWGESGIGVQAKEEIKTLTGESDKLQIYL